MDHTKGPKRVMTRLANGFRAFGIVVVLATWPVGGMAQDTGADSPTYGDVKRRLDQHLGESAGSLPEIQRSLGYLEQRILDAVETIEALRSENNAQRQAIKGLEDELAQVSAERGAAMRQQAEQIKELTQSLADARSEAETTRAELDSVKSELDAANVSRDALTAKVAALEQSLVDAKSESEKAARESAARIAALETRLAEQTAEADRLRTALATLESELKQVVENRDNLQAESGDLRADLKSAEAERQSAVSTLETRIQELADTLALERAEAGEIRGDLEKTQQDLLATIGVRDRLVAEMKSLQTDLASAWDKATAAELERNRTATDAQQERSRFEARLNESRQALETEKTVSETALNKVDLLNRQIAALRDQIGALGEALDASEAKNRDQKVQIASLGKRLNEALATKVAELARYRSEFFGKLRAVLGERQDVRIVGDRFVFQSEVLFGSGEAELGIEGREQLRRFAMSLREVSEVIPEDVDWILRVDGHTDRRPIATPRFPSNWELSTARAVSVVKFLIAEGIPARRLVAAGFGDLHPLDERDDEIAYRRNRRIEFKLTQR